MKKYSLSLFVILSIFILGIMGCKTTPEELVDEDPALVESSVEESIEQESKTELVVDTVKGEPNWVVENKILAEKIIEARVMAVAAGAELYLPDELSVLDVNAREIEVVYEDGGDAKEYNENAQNMLLLYQALEQASLASSRNERIVGFDFVEEDATNYKKGNEAYEKAQALFTNGAAGSEILAAATLAAESFDIVLKTAFNKKAREKRSEVLDVKKQADSVKAGVASKKNYTNAVAIFTHADQKLAEGESEQAYDLFSSSHEQMLSIYKEVKQKREVARESIDRAKQRIEESKAKAVEADSIAPIEESSPKQAAVQKTEQDETAKDGE
ncbi:MAG TPA: hypothetical protein VFC68_05345 [Treponemataceae bacterium]|nr:hypothetical protein [Treponemataceae bacterium]